MERKTLSKNFGIIINIISGFNGFTPSEEVNPLSSHTTNYKQATKASYSVTPLLIFSRNLGIRVTAIKALFRPFLLFHRCCTILLLIMATQKPSTLAFSSHPPSRRFRPPESAFASDHAPQTFFANLPAQSSQLTVKEPQRGLGDPLSENDLQISSVIRFKLAMTCFWKTTTVPHVSSRSL
jgi:hypothetical protein